MLTRKMSSILPALALLILVETSIFAGMANQYDIFWSDPFLSLGGQNSESTEAAIKLVGRARWHQMKAGIGAQLCIIAVAGTCLCFAIYIRDKKPEMLLGGVGLGVLVVPSFLLAKSGLDDLRKELFDEKIEN
jgi:hypothetical protein